MTFRSEDGLPDGTRHHAGRAHKAKQPRILEAPGFAASLVEHDSIEMEVPAQERHRISIALGRRPAVWTDIPGSKVAADLGHLHANIVPASHVTWVDDPTPGKFLFLEVGAPEPGDHPATNLEPIPAFNHFDPILAWASLALLELLGTGGWADDLRLDAIARAVSERLQHPDIAQPRPRRHVLDAWRKRQLMEFIDARLHTRISMKELAAIAGLPAFEFLAAFQSSFGVPPFRFVAFARIRDVRRRLVDSGSTPASTARDLGYDPDLLDVMFKAQLGLRMDDYRALRTG